MPHGQPDRLLDRGDAGCSPPAGPISVATSCQPNDEPSESGHGDVARQHERQIQSPLQFVVPRSEREFVLNHFDTSERPVPASRRGNGKRKLEAMLFEGTARKSYRRSALDASARVRLRWGLRRFRRGCYFPAPQISIPLVIVMDHRVGDGWPRSGTMRLLRVVSAGVHGLSAFNSFCRARY
jgi:hypothetical protein